MGTTTYVDHDDVEHQFENEPGDEDESVRNKVGLPNAVRTQLTNIAASLASLAGVVSAGRFGVDLTTGVTTAIGNIATYLNTIAASVAANRVAVDLATTPTSNLATLAGAITAARMAVDLATTPTANLATIAGAITASRMAVDLATTPTANLATLAGAISAARMAVNVDSTTQGKLDTLHTDLAPATTYIEQITGIPAVGGTASQFTSQTLVKGMVIRNCSTGGQLLYVTKSATTPTATNGYVLAPGESTMLLECTNANAFKILGSTSGGAACMSGS